MRADIESVAHTERCQKMNSEHSATAIYCTGSATRNNWMQIEAQIILAKREREREREREGERAADFGLTC